MHARLMYTLMTTTIIVPVLGNFCQQTPEFLVSKNETRRLSPIA